MVTALGYDIGHDGNPHADYSVRVRDALTFELLHTLPERVFAQRLTIAGSHVTVEAFNGPDLLWDFATGEVSRAGAVDGATEPAMPSRGEFEVIELDDDHPFGSADLDGDFAFYSIDFACGQVPLLSEAEKTALRDAGGAGHIAAPTWAIDAGHGVLRRHR